MIKSFHIIFIVTWFAGLFYLVRLFVYHQEILENKKLLDKEKELLISYFKMMEGRLLYGITWPSALLASCFGFFLIHNFFPLKDHPWLCYKLFLVFCLFLYHIQCERIFRHFNSNVQAYSGQQLRYWNEGATVLLCTIVFLVELQNFFSPFYVLGGIGVLSFMLYLGIRFRRR